MPHKPQDDAETGRLAGFGAGAVTGAQLGTVFIPVPFVGTFAGALIGGALGSRVGERFGPTIIGALSSGLPSQPKEQAPSRPTPIPITTPAAEASGASGSDLLAQLERLGQLRAQGVLTDEEFATAKALLLKR